MATVEFEKEGVDVRINSDGVNPAVYMETVGQAFRKKFGVVHENTASLRRGLLSTLFNPKPAISTTAPVSRAEQKKNQ